VRLHYEVFGLGVAILAIVTAQGRTTLRVLPLLPRSMMRLGRFRARLSYLWLLVLDPRLPNLITVWPDVSYDTTVMAGRLTLLKCFLTGSVILAFLHETKFFHS
jgi:hypothetical protein